MDLIERGANIALIADVLARFAQAADFGTLEEYAALMTEDFWWESPAMEAIGLPAQIRRGREDAVRGAQERRDAGIQGPGSGAFHVITNISVTPSDDVATAVSYWHFYQGGSDAPRLQSLGVYQDTFARVGTEWRIAGRRISRY